ncbi:MAG: fbaA fructose-bisphosphate aldolase, class [Clostridia bacterium]|jgi:fructose-bisphosphate aldolase class II|nr:fbaA fructose-bisphosphate aldolase, class [Clostridia bacterium]
MIINLNEAFLKQQNLVAFNFFNVETLAAILDAAKVENKVIILSFGESYISHTPLQVAAVMAKEYSKLYDIPFVLHLDHATKVDTIKQAIDLGFTSVMYDGSRLPLVENIKNTAEVVKLAKERNVTVEGELGYLNKEDGSDQVEVVCTTVEDSVQYVNQTKVDALAIAVGNAHGLYKREPQIQISRISEISAAVNLPLVLHGSSGIPLSILADAYKHGIRKINVNTELAITGCRGIHKYILEHGADSRLENALSEAKANIQASTRQFLKI